MLAAASAGRLMAGPRQGSEPLPDGQADYWYLPEVYWLAADRRVSVLKILRRRLQHHTVKGGQKLRARRQRRELEQVTTNYHASNLELGGIPPLLLYQLGRSRWRIDTEAFQTLTVDCHRTSSQTCPLGSLIPSCRKGCFRPGPFLVSSDLPDGLHSTRRRARWVLEAAHARFNCPACQPRQTGLGNC